METKKTNEGWYEYEWQGTRRPYKFLAVTNEETEKAFRFIEFAHLLPEEMKKKHESPPQFIMRESIARGKFPGGRWVPKSELRILERRTYKFTYPRRFDLSAIVFNMKKWLADELLLEMRR